MAEQGEVLFAQPGERWQFNGEGQRWAQLVDEFGRVDEPRKSSAAGLMQQTQKSRRARIGAMRNKQLAPGWVGKVSDEREMDQNAITANLRSASLSRIQQAALALTRSKAIGIGM